MKMMAGQWIPLGPPARGSPAAHKAKNHNVVGAYGTSLSIRRIIRRCITKGSSQNCAICTVITKRVADYLSASWYSVLTVGFTTRDAVMERAEVLAEFARFGILPTP